MVSESMRTLYARVRSIAPAPFPVLVQGETGTGKDWIARALHDNSSRHDGPFTVLDCSSIPETLIEATLFGTEHGAFTGALRTRLGVFEEACSGTVFLDEVGELPLAAQGALLRVLDGSAFRRVGRGAEIRPDVRVVAATNRDLQAMVQAQRFRKDLYFRLSASVLSVPPLRARREDIMPLAQFFLERIAVVLERPVAGIAPELGEILERYPWPGNVRELRNSVEAAAAQSKTATIGAEHFQSVWLFHGAAVAAPLEDAPNIARNASLDHRSRMRDFERLLIRDALRRERGNQRRAAMLLGLPHRTLVYKIRQLGIARSDHQSTALTLDEAVFDNETDNQLQ